MSDPWPESYLDRAQVIFNGAVAAGIFTDEEIANPDPILLKISNALKGRELTGIVRLDAMLYTQAPVIDETPVTLDTPHIDGPGENYSRTQRFFQVMFESVWGAFVGVFQAIFGGAIRDIKALKEPYNADATREELAWFIDRGMLSEETLTEFNRLSGNKKFLRFLLPIMAGVSSIITIITSIFTLGGADYNKKLLGIFTPGQPSVEQLIRLGFIAPGKTAEVRKGLKQNGMSEADQNLIFLASLNMLDVNTIQTLFLRGFISSDDVFQRMRQIGFTDSKTELIMKTWDVLPGVGELVTMVDREAFDDAIVSKYGYMEDSHKLPYEQFAKLGLSRYWVDKIWAAHWNLPSLEMGFRMLHRRIIDESELDDLFKIAEIPGYWRQRLIELSYNPLTRVDVRRMHATGVLTEQQVYESYLDIGYHHDNAILMTEFTVKYNEDEDRDLTRSQIETYYRNNLISTDEALGMLVDLGYSAGRAAFFLANQDYEREQEYVDDVIDNTGEMYRLRMIDYNTAQQTLYDLNLPAKQVGALFDKWNIRIFKDRKLPSKTDLDKFYKAGIITIIVYGEELEKLGYPERYVNMYMGLAEQGSK